MVHSFYSSAQPSGENTVVLSEVDALRRAGHTVELFAAHTDDLEGELLYKLRTGLRVATGYGQNPLKAINDFGPDVIHVHNLFPNFGARWVSDVTAPIVHTLHNYRHVCANGLLYREGRPCTLCPDTGPKSAVIHGCYRGSVLATAAVALPQLRGQQHNPLFQRAARILTLSARQEVSLISGGIPTEKIVRSSNFLPHTLDPGREPARDQQNKDSYWLFVGRLSPEKGILPLLQSWPADEPLMIIGDGELRGDIEDLSRSMAVDVAGQLKRKDVLRVMSGAVGLVFPSRCFENAPLVYIESLAMDLPILALGANTVAEFVQADGTGVARDLDGVEAPLAGVAEMRKTFQSGKWRPRQVFERKYSEESYIVRAGQLYRDVVESESI